MRPYGIEIDADASPSGYIAWFNHSNNYPELFQVRPAARNERYGVQRMEMLAIYFAISMNLTYIKKAIRRGRKGRRVTVCIRSDSKSTVEMLMGRCAIRDMVMQRIFRSIANLLAKLKCTIRFDHLERSNNIAGLLIEQKRRKERESQMVLGSGIEIYERPIIPTLAPMLYA